MPTIAILGTFDTKGEEHAFVAEVLKRRGHQVLLIDVGTGAPSTIQPDVSREQVAEIAGMDLHAALHQQDRGASVEFMSQAAPLVLVHFFNEKKIDGVISLGGGGGTAIATAGMRALPFGFPRVMVSTLASGNIQHYVGVQDITMIPSVVDIAGINRISREVFTRAAGAIAGMVEEEISQEALRPVIAASQFGNTTDCVGMARDQLERKDYEVLVFHATGTGGRTMEALIEARKIYGVLDITTTEWADELVGGVLTAGPTRLEAAARTGTPSVVVPGCLDMVNFHAPETVPEKFNGRLFYKHNPQVTLMRTTPEECEQLGKILAEKLNASKGPVAVLLPLKGISVISCEGQAFYDPGADQALFASLRSNLADRIEIIELEEEINSPVFAEACVNKLLALMK